MVTDGHPSGGHNPGLDSELDVLPTAVRLDQPERVEVGLTAAFTGGFLALGAPADAPACEGLLPPVVRDEHPRGAPALVARGIAPDVYEFVHALARPARPLGAQEALVVGRPDFESGDVVRRDVGAHPDRRSARTRPGRRAGRRHGRRLGRARACRSAARGATASVRTTASAPLRRA